jgi:oligopeptide/dipeptide ABC transporter ATP-binding protein
MTALLELRNVTKVYTRGTFKRSGTVALDNISLSAGTETPTIVSLAGESGSGKTTLGLLLLGFLSPTEGQVMYQGTDLRLLSGQGRELFRRNVQAIFQDPFAVYNPYYPVDHVLSVPIAKFGLAKTRAEARAKMEEALLGVGLRPEETLGRYPHQLSGGQLQRVTVARALLLRPHILVADEPVSMVDASLRATILDSLRKLNREFGISILYITHDLTTAYHISDSIVVLYQGSMVEVGEVDPVIRAPRHPYTQLLVASIPWPDPDLKWQSTRKAGDRREAFAKIATGCKFAPRCPMAMPMCAQSFPPFYQVEANRAVACYLYRDAPILSAEALSHSFASGPAHGSGHMST